jgi:hypothetical protein
MENSASADDWLINHGGSRLAGGTATGLLSPSAYPGLLGNGASWAISHPLQAAGAIQTVGGLLGNSGGGGGGGGNTSSGGGGSKSSGGGTNTGGFKAERPQFQPNPYLLAQLRAGGYIQ